MTRAVAGTTARQALTRPSRRALQRMRIEVADVVRQALSLPPTIDTASLTRDELVRLRGFADSASGSPRSDVARRGQDESRYPQLADGAVVAESGD